MITSTYVAERNRVAVHGDKSLDGQLHVRAAPAALANQRNVDAGAERPSRSIPLKISLVRRVLWSVSVRRYVTLFLSKVREQMSDRIFYVGAQDKAGNFTGYVPAKFLTINGQPIVDPTPGGRGRTIPYIYSDDKGTAKSDDANPNNYMIVPANFDEERARVR